MWWISFKRIGKNATFKKGSNEAWSGIIISKNDGVCIYGDAGCIVKPYYYMTLTKPCG